METENSRRTFDKSREPGLKKPRLTQDPTVALDRASNGRPRFMQRPAARGGDSESGDSIRGPYPQTQNDHVELVNQYRTALAELTFNSKPIITNLTIIAGENLHAAKAIASIVCYNILEVPREQKLPSLYLLDSIVKNIGRDYIKYFGAKLPEVFCKAYRQVDPSIHPGMRHLFGTWKGVFPPQPLQAIEKELGFATAVNSLPSGTTSPRVDAPVSRSASIHVNPKYLEARQRLQQSTKAKVAGNDFSETTVNSTTDLGGLERTSVGSGRPFVDVSTKSSQYIQRERSDVMRSQNVSPPFGDDEYDLDIPSQSGLEPGREKFSGNVRGTVSTQRNGHGVQNYPLDRRRQPNYGLTSQSTIPMNVSWKNSEEEEYIWDDMNSRVGEHDNGTSSARDHWSHDDSEKLSEASADSLSTEMKDQGLSGNLGLSSWLEELPLSEKMRSLAGRAIPIHSDNYPVSTSEFSAPTSSKGRTSFRSKVGLGSIGSAGYGPSNTPTVGSTLSAVPQRQTLGDASSVQSLLYPPGSRGIRPVSIHNRTARNQPQARTRAEPRTSQYSGSLNKDPRIKLGQESLPLPSQNAHLPNKKVHSPSISSSFSEIPSQLKEHTSFSQQIESEPDLSHQVQKPFSHALSSTGSFSDDQIPLPSLSSGQSSTNSLLATVSGILNSNSIFGRFSHQNSQTSVSEENNLPPPSGPSQTQSSPSMSISPLSSLAALSSILPQRKADGSPFCLPISAALSSSSLEQSPMVTDGNAPVSSLLSSLVAKGLLSATKTESTSILAQPKNHSPETASCSSQVPLPLVTLPISSSYTMKEESSSKPVSVSTELPPSPQAEMKSLIGFQFKGDVLRRLHPAVISQLFEDFPHKCGICEGRLKIEDQVGRHLEWHALRNRENYSNKASRIWYADSNSILAEAGDILSADEPSGPNECLTKRPECCDSMVSADESQCLCILCGELFEDYYDQGMAQWMFKGAVYANVSCLHAVIGRDENVIQDSIVHERCISKLTPNTPEG